MNLRYKTLLKACLCFYVLTARDAHAYAWFIGEGYSHCVQCHVDPSGAGLLTPYGRAVGDTLLYGGDGNTTANFLWGSVDVPDNLWLGGSIRNGVYAMQITPAGGPSIPMQSQFLQMQADVYGAWRLGILRLYGSLGYLHEQGQLIQLTTAPIDNLVSRTYWAALSFAEDEWLWRVGRMNLPFGLRGNEHTMWVRTLVRDSINDAQQLGTALAYNHDRIRFEGMLYLGNPQVSPRIYRERGAAGYVEYALGLNSAVGVSLLVAHADLDLQLTLPLTRQAYGIFGRYSPWHSWVLLAEADVVVHSTTDTSAGYVAMLQSDTQIIPGVHVVSALEIKQDPALQDEALGAWAGLVWFCLPHTDIKLDGIYQNLPGATGRNQVVALLAQLHVYL